MNTEPVLAINDIQGNILGGFNKDHQALIPVQFGKNFDALRGWLATVTLTDLSTVVSFKRKLNDRIANGQSIDDLQALWVNLCFTWNGLRKLTVTAEQFTDSVFRNGFDGVSSRAIGDSEIKGVPGEQSSWIVGGPTTVPDMLVIIGADRPEALDHCARTISTALGAAGCNLLHTDIGRNLSYFSTDTVKYPSGHEHFGFRDGISQPGVRGRLSDRPADWLALRPASRPGGSTDLEYAQPGQVLVWPGEFVFGYARQSFGAARLSVNGRKVGPPPPSAPDPAAVVPWWGINGSYLVFRRLYQDVAAFRTFVAAQAAQVSADIGHFVSAETLAALLVGRWPSGAPVILSPDADQQMLGDNDDRNNDFDFSSDQDGTICPLAAHIRKINPRNVGTDQGSPAHTLVRRLLRRGIPYGIPLPPGAGPDGQDRGLLFLSYQTDIQEQFMFLAASWANAPNAPIAAVSQVRAREEVGDGYDMIIGQAPNENRTRFCVVRDSVKMSRINTALSPVKEWVVPTGGGFFFSPAISAVRQILSVG